MVPGSLGCGSAVLAAITMLAPSRAARMAIALPIPRVPPVTNTVFPASFLQHQAHVPLSDSFYNNTIPFLDNDIFFYRAMYFKDKYEWSWE